MSKSFFDLFIWKRAHSFVLKLYKITHSFPKEETYGIISQMRRAGVSISSNIAEGFSRFGKKEKVQFLYMSLGSVTECQNLIFISRDLAYITSDLFTQLMDDSIEIAKLINSSITSFKAAVRK